MSRNSESRFASTPQANIKRTMFDMPIDVKSSFNVGQLVPFMKPLEVLPGDTFQFKTSKVVRLSTLKCPPMDSLFLDTYYFYIPARVLWSHWVNLMGENTDSAWLPTVSYTMPQVTAPTGGWSAGSIADFMGIPTGVDNFSVNALPFRAYCKVVDDWFRDENVDDPVSWSNGDATVAGSNGTNYITDMAKGGAPFIANRLHDYFSSCLPAPLKHADVTIPLGKTAGVYTGSTDYDFGNFPKDSSGYAYPVHIKKRGAGQLPDNGNLYSFNGDLNVDQVTGSESNLVGSYFSNLYADLSNATAATISQLRLAFQLQKFYERSALYGSRYTETILGHFGVSSPDARLQRSEYLGGNRITLNITNVAQTASSDTTSPQGNLAAFSQTVDTNGDFIRSFTEHGYILGLMVARYKATFQQGLDRLWSRKTLEDFYWPEFQALSNQAVLNKEIYLQGVTSGAVNDNTAFGYQEAYAEYRYIPPMCTNQMRSTYSASLDAWHYGDEYNTLPTLSSSWMKVDKGNVDRSLAVTSAVSSQLIADIHVNARATRPMPLYSIPGLLDHF